MKTGTGSPKPPRARSNSLFAPSKPKVQSDPMGFLVNLGIDIKGLAKLLTTVNQFRDRNEGLLTQNDVTYINVEFKKLLGNIEDDANVKLTSILLKVLTRSMENDGFQQFNTYDSKKIDLVFMTAIASDPLLSKEFHDVISTLGSLADNYKEAYASFMELAQFKNRDQIMEFFRIDSNQETKQNEQKVTPLARISAASNNTTIKSKIETNQKLINFDVNTKIPIQRQADFAENVLRLKSIDPAAPNAQAQRVAAQKSLVHSILSPDDFRNAVINSFAPYLAGQLEGNTEVADMINRGDDEGLKAIIMAKYERLRTSHDFGGKLKKELDNNAVFQLKAMCHQYKVKFDMEIYESNDPQLRYYNTESLADDFSQISVKTVEDNYLQQHKLSDLLLGRFKQEFGRLNKNIIKNPEAYTLATPSKPSTQEIQADTQRRDAAQAQIAVLKKDEKPIAPPVEAHAASSPPIILASYVTTSASDTQSPATPVESPIMHRLKQLTGQLTEAAPPRLSVQEHVEHSRPRSMSSTVNPAFKLSQTQGNSSPASSAQELDDAKQHLKELNLFGKKEEPSETTKSEKSKKKL